jgi:prepilin-type N-terminal cleavage/methylation domain-containing protein
MKRHQRHLSSAPRARRGVTLIELIIAMTILSVGLLAIVGTSARIAVGLGEARSDNLAAVSAASRFELLAGTACSGLTLGTVTEETTRGIKERWMVNDAGNNTRELIDSVSWTTRRSTRRQVFRSLIPCRTGA